MDVDNHTHSDGISYLISSIYQQQQATSKVKPDWACHADVYSFSLKSSEWLRA